MVKSYPALIADNMTGDLTSPAVMSIPTLRGPIEQAWVEFDEPQFDGTGTGHTGLA